VQDWITPALGTIAGIASTISFAPQVLKAWREGTETVSRRMYLITVSAFALWIAYGVLLGSLPIMIFNSLSLVLSGLILAMKLRDERRAAQKAR
jgi:MtN3 and saliva related transmembrane protein